MDTPILTNEIERVDKSLGDSYLKFHLDADTAAILAMQHVEAVLIVPSRRLTAIPNMPECILGLLNRRNRVFWVIDLAQMLNFQPVDPNAEQYNIVMIRVGEIPLGLLVQAVQGLIRITPDSIQAPMGLVTPTLIPYLHGCILQQQEAALVLNAQTILHSPLLHGHSL